MKLYLIRHGLSCGNLMAHKDIHLAPLNAFNRDPLLTEVGVQQSKKCSDFIDNKLNLKPDLVISSALIRSIETALHMFPKSDVHIIPYISEKNKTLENIPCSINHQKQRIQKETKALNRCKFPESNKGLKQCDLTKFIKYLQDNFDIEDRTICIISHSHFLMDILNINDKMNNNAIYHVVIQDNKVTQYKKIFSGYKLPYNASIKMLFR